MLPEDSRDRERDIYLAVLESCREVRKLFAEQQAEEGLVENPGAPELLRYRQSLEAGLDRLQGKFKEALGGSDHE